MNPEEKLRVLKSLKLTEEDLDKFQTILEEKTSEGYSERRREIRRLVRRNKAIQGLGDTSGNCGDCQQIILTLEQFDEEINEEGVEE